MAESDPLKAILINCSITPRKADSHTQRLLNRVAGVLEAEGVDVTHVYALEHAIATGMLEDGAVVGLEDEWPGIEERILASDILVLGTPIWLGQKSSVATRVIERMYASSGRRNDRGQWLYYGRTAGCVVTGNEDGVKHCAMDLLYALQHIGYMIPPQADCGWIGEAGPGPSYGDRLPGGGPPVGYDNDFTNRNATYMAWNLMHTARMLRAAGGLPAVGNTTEGWEHVSNAKDQNPEYR
ncbi:MAG TPA: flavodoxin family protein [Amnibacterium sp.]